MGDISPLVPCIICYMSSARWFPGWTWNPLALTQCSHLSPAADSPRGPRKLPNTCCHGQMLLRLGNIRLKYTVAGPISFWRKCMSYLFYFQKQSISTTYIKSDLFCKFVWWHRKCYFSKRQSHLWMLFEYLWKLFQWFCVSTWL